MSFEIFFICLVTINEYLNAIVLVFSPLSSSSSSFHTHLCCRGRLHCSFFSRLFYLLRLSALPSLIVFGGGIVMALLSLVVFLLASSCLENGCILAFARATKAKFTYLIENEIKNLKSVKVSFG